MEQNILTKQIQVVNLQPQFIAKLNKNKYAISGNDGIKYETWDADYFAQRKIGEWLNIQYVVRQTQGSNGRVYTNYDISNQQVVGSTPSQQKSNPNQAIETIIQRINALENNIIAAIRIHCGDMKLNKDSVPNQFDNLGTANANLQMTSDKNKGIPIIEENADGSYSTDENPF